MTKHSKLLVSICLMLAVVLWLCLTHTAESLECFTCTNIHNVSDCRAFSTCQADEQCFTKTTGLENQTVFSLGCRSAAQCLGSTTQSSIHTIVGRDITDRSASTECDQCCSVEFCNIKLCNHAVDVHGGWSLWSAWGSCSVTCGVGLMRRDRTCSNPYPDLNGDHCFGDSRDDRACFERACADGGWSQWADWGSCSASCGGGLKTRSRTCSNPPPSQLGKNCEGNNEDKELCNTKPCPVPMVAFTAYAPTGTLLGGGVPTFRTIVENSGGGYNKATGVFTCTVPGLYHFNVDLLVNDSSTVTTYCYIVHNASITVRAYVPSGGLIPYSGSTSIYLHLSAADTVHLRCTHWTNISRTGMTMFTGALITPE